MLFKIAGRLSEREEERRGQKKIKIERENNHY